MGVLKSRERGQSLLEKDRSVWVKSVEQMDFCVKRSDCVKTPVRSLHGERHAGLDEFDLEQFVREDSGDVKIETGRSEFVVIIMIIRMFNREIQGGGGSGFQSREAQTRVSRTKLSRRYSLGSLGHYLDGEVLSFSYWTRESFQEVESFSR